MKTLQEQFNLITEGKGNKNVFLKEAKRLYPNLVNNSATFNETTKILKNKSVLNENYIDLQPINTLESHKDVWELKYKNFLSEEAKVEEKKTTKEVEEIQDHSFDNQDWKNLDNQLGQEVLNGIYFEAKENPSKSLEDIKEIVSKNLDKDSTYYIKNAAFGVKGIGYKETELEEVSGKYAASGYSDKVKEVVKESLMGDSVITSGNPNSYASQAGAVIKQMMEEDKVEEETAAKTPKKEKSAKKKKESLDNDLAEIDKQAQVVALEAKLAKVDEVIEGKMSRINMVSEDENLKDLVDGKKMKAIQKEVKVLEKRKAKMEKMYEKMAGKKYQREEIVDEEVVNGVEVEEVELDNE